MSRPTAAPHVWPYPERTVAEVEADERRVAETMERYARNAKEYIVRRYAA